jgi:hypothetical protein
LFQKGLLLLVSVDGDDTQVGSQLGGQSQVDDDDTAWTYIDQKPFTKPGTLQSIELMACTTGKPLKVGIYRPTTSKMECTYSLMGELSFSAIGKSGYNKVLV